MASTRTPAIVNHQDGEEQKELKLHPLDPRRKSVLILASLLATITLLVAAGTLTLAGNTKPTHIATLNASALITALSTFYIIIRIGIRITALEFWIRRMGAGDLEHSVPPKGHDELTEIAYDLEVLRERSIRSQELDLVRQLSEQVQDKNEILEQTLVELHNTQDQVVSKQKLAEIGELAAGIAHEVRNPLNIISNYSATSTSLMQELVETLDDEDTDQGEKTALAKEITDDLKQNMSRIGDNCDRASRIIQDVTNMSRNAPSPERPVELNKMLHDYAILAYQANRAQDQSFNIKIDEDLAADVGEITCVPEELSRVFINISVQRLLRHQRETAESGHTRRLLTAHEAHHTTPRREHHRHHPRQRHRHAGPRTGEDIQPLLHHQTHQRGHRPRTQPLPRNRPPPRGEHHR